MAISSRIARSCDELRNQLDEVAADLPRLQAEAAHGDSLADHLIDRLRVAYENGEGCIVLADNNLPVPLLTVTRSLFESLISTFWASLSESNAQTVVESSRREMARLLRNVLCSGRAVVQDRTTGEDVTEKVLKSPVIGEAQRPPKFNVMANAARIKNIYDDIYGFLSMFSHGTATEILVRMGREEPTFAALETSRAILESLELIAVNHIREQRQTSRGELERILNVKLSS